jgi:hypothetical protein
MEFLSKYHEKYPFIFKHDGHHQIQYEPGESRSNMFGGNSNWRGPIWMPLNYMIIQSLRKYYTFMATHTNTNSQQVLVES